MKKLLLMLVGIVCSLVTMAASVNDLVAIDKNWTFIADEITSNGTASLTANTLYCNGYIFAPTANSKTSNKGSNTFAGGSHLNSLRVKLTQDQLVFKLAQACTVTFYTQSHSSRGINLGTTNGGTNLGVQPVSTTEWSVNLPAGVVYMSSYGGDFFFAGFVVSGIASADKAPTISVPATYTGDTKHTINVKATVDGSPEPTVQWYSNTTASNEDGEAIEGATSATYQFNPSEAGTYYLYAIATNKAGSATSDVTTVTVATSYEATFSKGETEAIGTAPQTIYTEGDGKITIPKNYSLYVDGKTLTSWTDGENEYEPGKEYTLTADVALTPKFVDNVKTLASIKNETTVHFINKNSVAATYQSADQNAIVEHLTIDGQATDVALIVQNGKFDLQPANPRAQTNQGTKISIPVVNGAVVSINIYDNKDDGKRTYDATINGEAVEAYLGAESGKQRVMTYTYSGEAKFIDYVVNSNNMYAYSIDVTYASPTTLFTMSTAATGDVSIDAESDKVELPAAAKLSVKGGSVAVSNGQDSAKNLITKSGFAMTNGNTFFTVTLTGNKLRAGDVITATMSADGRGLKFATATAYSTDYPGEAAATTAFSYTITEDDTDLIGATTFNIFRASSNSTYFNNFKITRPYEAEHTFSEEWSSDSKNHWHAATCQHEDEVSDLGAHEWVNDVCTVCGKVKPTVAEVKSSVEVIAATAEEAPVLNVTFTPEAEGDKVIIFTSAFLNQMGANILPVEGEYYDMDGKQVENAVIDGSKLVEMNSFSIKLDDENLEAETEYYAVLPEGFFVFLAPSDYDFKGVEGDISTESPEPEDARAMKAASDINIESAMAMPEIRVSFTAKGGIVTMINSIETLNNGVKYNLAGQIVNNGKGIIILDGKKLFVK